MELRPIAIRDAKAIVKAWHRHLKAPVGAKFAIAAWKDGQLVGVAFVGRPVSRHVQKQEPFTAEITRVATDGTRNACSFLYSHAKRAAQALGYRKVITKTLPTESGASLRAVGAIEDGQTRDGDTWSCPSRPRTADIPTEGKQRWIL